MRGQSEPYATVEFGRCKVVPHRRELVVGEDELVRRVWPGPISRQASVRDVTALVTRHRLVTLTGIAGIGQARLALEVARRRAAFYRRFTEGCGAADLVAARALLDSMPAR